MNRISSVAMFVLLAGLVCLGQTATPAPAPAQATTPNAVGHGAFPVKVTKTLDSSKLKEDDSVEVETSGSFKLPDGTLVPKGSKLAGRVTASKARSKGDSASELNIVFTRLDIPNGKQVGVKGVVQAVFPPPDEADSGVAGGQAISHAAGLGPPPADAKMGANTESSTKPQPAMDPKSVGVRGIHDLELGQDGVLTSKGKHVKLDSGVRMIVRVDILG
jgi:hypothetical protein